MIDFNKIGTGNTVDTVIPPREIFNALPKKDAIKFQYPRDVQSQVWKKWYERRNESSLVIKMNTGSGKTVVGLIILKSCLNEGSSPAVYVCPDNYLVKQAMDAAQELGIEVTDDAQSPRFLSGRAILVVNIHKLVNGKSAFGVGDEGSKIKISSLVIDDAHACLDTVEEQFTVNIPSGTAAYDELYQEVKNSLHSECESKALEIESGDPASYMQVPYWTWQEKISEISRILISHNSQDHLRFSWPLVKESLKLSSCVISSTGIEISPHSVPIHMIPSVVDADRKVFMTATLVDDSILASHFAVSEDQIKDPVVPDSAGDVGDRMILLPQVINTETTDDDIKKYARFIAQYMNVVVIVPSKYRSNFWRDSADMILNASNLYGGVESLKSGHVGLTVLINKYDGVDLPGDACRLLIIDGFPDVRRKIDKVKQGILMGCPRQSNQVIQRIEQGMGRGIRSNDDFCVVFLIGRDLTSQLYAQGAIDKLSPATKAQLTLSDQLAEQIKGKAINEITDTLSYCWSQDDRWVTASKGALASLTYSEEHKLDSVILAGRKAYDLALSNNPVQAASVLDALVQNISDRKERGFIKQMFAEYTNLYDKAEAQKIQMSAIYDNRRILKPIDGIQYHKILGDAFDQASMCSNYLQKRHSDPNKLVIEVNGILECLKFKEGTSNKFEEALKDIAKYIGFDSQRPEQDYKKGPDVLWKIGDLKYIVIEAKNEATTPAISKAYCNQLNGSCNWFEQKYDETCSYFPLLIHPSSVFEYAASPEATTRIMDEEKLESFVRAVRAFVSSICSNNEMANQVAIREKLITYRLRAIDIENNYSISYQNKNQ